MPHQRANEFSISLPHDLLEFVDSLARQQAKSRSAIIADLISNKQDAQIKSMMADGYRMMAE